MHTAGSCPYPGGKAEGQWKNGETAREWRTGYTCPKYRSTEHPPWQCPKGDVPVKRVSFTYLPEKPGGGQRRAGRGSGSRAATIRLC